MNSLQNPNQQHRVQQLLTQHLAIWTTAETEKRSGRGRASGNAGSVYGIKKLRELILELAVRGKLVPQAPNDEPASVLLKRIQAEKAKLIAEDKIKKEKPLAPISEDEKPFELPKGWEWVRNHQLFQLRKGRIPKSFNESRIGLPYLDIDALDRNIIKRYSDELTCPQSTANDILVVCDGSRSGLVLDGKIGIIGSTLSIIDTPIFIQNYIKLIFKQGFVNFNTTMKGAAIPHLDTQKLLQNPTALPPLAEQHRIVAKVDELMALCDQLENQHQSAQQAHETLVSVLLDILTHSQNAAEFQSHWQRIVQHFDVLFTTEASIDALKQTLLQLAVMGKLVLQDPNDEPASELLKRIQAEKAKLIAEGKLKKEKPLAPISEDEKPFELPKGWEWAIVENIAHVGTGATPLRSKPEYFNPRTFSWVTSGETSSPFISNTEQYISPLALKETNLTLYPKGTLIVAMYGQGKTRGQVTELTIEACTNQACAAIRLFNEHESHRKYVKLFFEKIYDEIRELSAGGAQPNLNLSKVKETLIPLPPLAEQHRIVAKVDALMVLCDQLKTRIQLASQQEQRIADALVAQALQPISAEIIDLASYRNAVACYTIKQMQNKPSFGRTQAVKLLYLAQNHAGLGLDLQFERKAAGPLVQWIYDFERQGEREQWFTVSEKSIAIGKTKVEYQVKSAIAKPSGFMEKLCSADQRKELDRVLTLFADRNTEEAEIIATLFAVWNDFLIDGISPDDAQIIKEVRENWHESKARFSPAELTKWLNWMRSNRLVPKGIGSQTIFQKKLIN